MIVALIFIRKVKVGYVRKKNKKDKLKFSLHTIYMMHCSYMSLGDWQGGLVTFT